MYDSILYYGYRIGESAPYEVMCLWIAKVIMLVDNIQLALRHWSQEQPYLVCINPLVVFFVLFTVESVRVL